MKISFSTYMQLATTCGSRSRTMPSSCSFTRKLLAVSGAMMYSLRQPMTAVLRTYGVWSARPFFSGSTTYSVRSWTRTEQRERSAR